LYQLYHWNPCSQTLKILCQLSWPQELLLVKISLFYHFRVNSYRGESLSLYKLLLNLTNIDCKRFENVFDLSLISWPRFDDCPALFVWSSSLPLAAYLLQIERKALRLSWLTGFGPSVHLNIRPQLICQACPKLWLLRSTARRCLSKPTWSL